VCGRTRRPVAEICGAVGKKAGKRSEINKCVFAKSAACHAACATARAVAMPATIGVGRAILAGVGFNATVVERCAMLIARQCRLLMRTGVTTGPNDTAWEGRKTGYEEQNVEVKLHN
jgi:hypothetical protein